MGAKSRKKRTFECKMCGRENHLDGQVYHLGKAPECRAVSQDLSLRQAREDALPTPVNDQQVEELLSDAITTQKRRRDERLVVRREEEENIRQRRKVSSHETSRRRASAAAKPANPNILRPTLALCPLLAGDDGTTPRTLINEAGDPRDSRTSTSSQDDGRWSVQSSSSRGSRSREDQEPDANLHGAAQGNSVGKERKAVRPSTSNKGNLIRPKATTMIQAASSHLPTRLGLPNTSIAGSRQREIGMLARESALSAGPAVINRALAPYLSQSSVKFDSAAQVARPITPEEDTHTFSAAKPIVTRSPTVVPKEVGDGRVKTGACRGAQVNGSTCTSDSVGPQKGTLFKVFSRKPH